MMDILKSLWTDPTSHQLIVSLCLTICMVVGTKLAGMTGVAGFFGKLLQKISEWLGTNPKH